MSILFIILYLVISTETLAELRPMALKPVKECELWVGTANGNDPTVQVELSLCIGRNGKLTGILQWSSIRSGWSKRSVSGAKYTENSSIILHDQRFLENKPNQGWRFCLIDEYSLSYSKDKLVGNYFSKACNDQAKLSFVLKSKN